MGNRKIFTLLLFVASIYLCVDPNQAQGREKPPIVYLFRYLYKFIINSLPIHPQDPSAAQDFIEFTESDSVAQETTPNFEDITTIPPKPEIPSTEAFIAITTSLPEETFPTEATKELFEETTTAFAEE